MSVRVSLASSVGRERYHMIPVRSGNEFLVIHSMAACLAAKAFHT